jgi:hypothetical protein
MVAPWLISLLVSIVLNVAAYALQPKPPRAKPEAAADPEGPTAEDGIPIPVYFGTVIDKSPNCLGYWDKRTRQFSVNA